MKDAERLERERLASLILEGARLTETDRKNVARFLVGNKRGRSRGATQKAIDDAVFYLQEADQGGTESEIFERIATRITEKHGKQSRTAEAIRKNIERHFPSAVMAQSMFQLYQRHAGKPTDNE